MSLLKWLKKDDRKTFDPGNVGDEEIIDDEQRRREEEEVDRDGGRGAEEEQQRPHDQTKYTVTKELKVFTVEDECIEYLAELTNKIFLIFDGAPPISLIDRLDPIKNIDSVFVFSPSVDDGKVINEKTHTYLVNWCENETSLLDSISKSRDELDKQTTAFSMYNKKEKATRDLSKEAGSFLFFQLFKSVLKNMPRTAEAKKTMVTLVRNYYRGNLTELTNIEEFDKNYRAEDAIPWYTKECFVYKFINKALRTEDVDVLYQFRFYIIDLSEQLYKKFELLKEKQKDILKLYRGQKLSTEEIANVQNSLGNLISTNGYLSTSSDHAVAYGFATKSAKRDGVVRALWEYQVDLQNVKEIVIADIREYSAFPEEAEVLVDIGASFQIDSCHYSADDDLWHIQVHATDQGAALAAEYMEYQKKKMMESNIVLMFGNLLLEMGEYSKAEKYFDTILNSSNPNDEEIACIFFNFGRTHRLKGDFSRAINCYNRAYNLHMNAKPKRAASAGKTLNGLGVVYTEQGKLSKAEECFLRTMKLYKKRTLDCVREDYERAYTKFVRAKKIYDRLLPPGHPNRALPRVNLGNVYLAAAQYDSALEEYESALKLQEASLPGDHPDIARTLHNLALIHANRGNMDLAKVYLDRAEETAGKTLTAKHPVMTLLGKTKTFMVEETQGYIYTRH